MKTWKELTLGLGLAGTIAFGAPPDTTSKTQPEKPRAGAEGLRTFSREELPGPPLPEEAPIPQGSKADVFSWKLAIDLQNELVIRRKAAEDLLRRFQREQHDARLVELIAQSDEAGRKRLHEVRKRLGYAWKAVNDLVTAPWPVDTRLGCRAQVLDIESALSAALGSAESSNLPDARLRLRACTKKVQGIVGPLKAAGETLAAAFAAADVVLGPAASVPGLDAGVTVGGR